MRYYVHEAIQSELKAQKRYQRSLWISIDSIEILEETPGRFIYRLDLSEELKITSDSIISIKIPGNETIFKVLVLVAIENLLIVVSEEPLPQQMALVRFQFDPGFILQKLDEHLDQVLRFPPKPLQAILNKSIPNPDHSKDTFLRDWLKSQNYSLNLLQAESVIRMQADMIHVLWGPPGTGKTFTLGVSIAEHLKAGKSCLLLSTSNVAVDSLVNAAAKSLGDLSTKTIFRTGASTDKNADQYTSLGYFIRKNPHISAKAQKAQTRLNEITSTWNSNSTNSPAVILREIQQCKEMIRIFAQSAKLLGDNLLQESKCIASTLANLVISSTLSEREFDVVYIDEASMVSLSFAFAGAAQATKQVIFAGDFRQLPPICHSEDEKAKDWFAKNIFDFLGITRATRYQQEIPFLSMLKEQYRMTEPIASIVSQLSYGGKLETQESQSLGSRPIFINVANYCDTSCYSVQDKSYYQPYSIPLLEGLINSFRDVLGNTNLILSPFRSQSKLLESVAKDLSTPNLSFQTSTIHKAQGSQEDTVIVDLTSHSVLNPQKFFVEEEAENLINVAISRAQNKLIIIGNIDMISILAKYGGYWERFYKLMEEQCIQISAYKIIANVETCFLEESLQSETSKDNVFLPSVYVENEVYPCTTSIQNIISSSKSNTKLILLNNPDDSRIGKGITYRGNSKNSVPVLAMFQGKLYLPLNSSEDKKRWLVTNTPEGTKKMALVTCGHLFDTDFNVKDTFRLLCPKGHSLSLVGKLGRYKLTCESAYCYYSRQLTLKDAEVIIQTQSIFCSSCGAKPQPRVNRSDGSVFVSCSNYPLCKNIINLANYTDSTSKF